MRKTRIIRRKVWAVVTAATLVLSAMPTTALASQTNATVSLASSTAQGVSEGDDSLGENSAALPYASARAVQMSVTAPLRVTFEGSGNDAYDVNNKSTWGTLSAPVQFTNLCSKTVYLSDVEVQQTTDANVGNVFSGTVGSSSNPFLTLQNAAANGAETATLATLAGTTATSHMQFGSSSAAADQKRVAKKFKIAKNATGSGVSSSFTLKLDPASATLRSTADLAASNSLKGTITDFAKMVWTFAVSTFDDPTVADGTASTAKDGFYLKIADSPVSAALAPYAGNCYSLDQVQAHSKLLGSGEVDTTSELYKLYYALVTSMAPEGDYICMVKYANEDWRIRIIGLNQDYAAESFSHGEAQYASGDRVGLTFEFINCPIVAPLSSLSTNSGGWLGNGAATARENLTSGTYYNSIAVNANIVPVKKYCATKYNDTNVQVASSKLFILSRYEEFGELCRNAPYDKFTTYKSVPFEGVGNPAAMADTHNTQYLFYSTRGLTGGTNSGTETTSTYRWTTKLTGATTTTSYVTSVNGGNASTLGVQYWNRSPEDSIKTFKLVGPTGTLGYSYLPTASYGIIPCFCL